MKFQINDILEINKTNNLKQLIPMKKLIFTLSIAAWTIAANAQITVNASNNVGIGTGATSAASKLSVNGIGNSSNDVYINNLTGAGLSIALDASNTIQTFGISSSVSRTNVSAQRYRLVGVLGQSYAGATAQTSGQTIGIFGIAGNSTDGWNCGVYGRLQGSRNGAAVYGEVNGANWIPVQPDTMYAGYFVGKVKVQGNLWATGTITSSDDRLKQSIISMDSTDGLFNLKPKKYKYKSLNDQLKATALKTAASVSDTAKNTTFSDPDPSVSQKTHFGFLAQDLQTVYPDLVYQSADGTLGVDYQGLIPIIIGQLQKMQQSIIDKDSQIKDLKKRLQVLENKKP